MTASKHVWGESAASDRVWAQVNGLAPAKAGRRLLAVWQAYIDESIDQDIIVLGGFVAPAENWAAFASEWAQMLPFAVRKDDNSYHFKMMEMAKNSERLERAQAFYRIIEKHVSFGLTVTMKLDEFRRARERIVVIDHPNGIMRMEKTLFFNPYLFSFYQVMMAFHENREAASHVLPVEQKVDFIFDERSEKKHILESWDAFLSTIPNKEIYGATPRFENDEEFLPLQAADFLCWWMREWETEGLEYNSTLLPWPKKQGFPVMQGSSSEDSLFDGMKRRTAAVIPKSAKIYDANTFINSQRQTF